jgi:hypothetical protein
MNKTLHLLCRTFFHRAVVKQDHCMSQFIEFCKLHRSVMQPLSSPPLCSSKKGLRKGLLTLRGQIAVWSERRPDRLPGYNAAQIFPAGKSRLVGR